MKTIIKLIAHIRTAGAICSIVLILAFVNPALAGPDCVRKPEHPSCSGGGDPGGEGNAAPRIVYRNGGIYLANADGASQTEIRPGGIQPKLDAPGGRVLFYDYPSLGNANYLGLIPYHLDSGNIVVESEQILLDQADISPDGIIGKFRSRGLTDWSPGGNKYAYNIYQDYGDGLGIRNKIMVAPILVASDGTISTTAFEEHVVAWESAPDGGLGFGAWDASGDYVYLIEDFNGPTAQQWLLVLDVRTNPGTIVRSVDLTDYIGANGFGFSSGSQAQAASASDQTGGLAGGYSFDPANIDVVLSRPDTSLCLVIPLIDWGYSNKHPARFTMIFDLPNLFHANSGLSCPLTTGPTATIRDFEASDFTTDDAGIVGTDFGKRPYVGVTILDLSDNSRTKIISDGGYSDWSN
jgi:hypothetical protein